MTRHRYPGPGEIIFVLIFAVGLLTLGSIAVGGVLSGVKLLLSPSTWQSLVVGTPWALGGIVVGFILGVYYMEETES